MIKYEKLPPDILSKIPEAQTLLLEDGNIIFAYLFGGLAKGILKPLSDIDIAAFVKDGNNTAEYKFDLFCRLSDVLGTAELDLIFLNEASTALAGRILQNKQLLVDKEPCRRHIFESVSLRKFFDFKIKEDAIFKRRFGNG